MSAEVIESRIRRFLLIIVLLIFIGTLIELYLHEHHENRIQKIPIYLSGLGAFSIGWVYLQTNRWSLYGMRLVMLMMGAGGGYGVYEHFVSNRAFEAEIRPNATSQEIFREALSGGNPLLAPSIVSLAALLALLATYQHPVITKRTPPSK